MAKKSGTRSRPGRGLTRRPPPDARTSRPGGPWRDDLAEVSKALLSPHTIEEIADLVLGCAKRLTGSPLGYVGYIDEPTGHMIVPTLTKDVWHACKVPGKSIVFEEFTGLWGWVLIHRELLVTNAPEQDPRWGGGPPRGHLPIERFLSAPAVAEGEVLGQVSVANATRNYNNSDLELIKRLADIYAMAVRHQRMVDALRRGRDRMEEMVRQRTGQLSQVNEKLGEEVAERRAAERRALRSAALADALARVAIRIGAHLDLPEIMKTVCDEAVRALGVQRCSLFLCDADRHVLVRASAAGHPLLGFSARESLPLNLVEDAFREGKDVIPISNIAKIPDAGYAELLQRDDVRAVVLAAMRFREELVGLLCVLAIGRARFFTGEECEFLRALAEQAAVAISQARLFDQQRTAKAQLEALSRRLTEIQEQERKAIARNLHDELGQGLTQLRLLLEATACGADTDPRRQAGDAVQLVHSLLARTREMTQDLRPRSLDDFGLLPALSAFTDRFGRRTGVLVEVKANLGDGRFPPEIETAAYRIVQESLSNVARHAAVKAAAVRLWSDGETLRIQVEDAGHGFDTSAVLHGGQAASLVGMRERAQAFGGQLTIESSPERGTCITVDIPLRQPPS
ncbi:MAG: GAF domain-containing protein [Acidobacteriota bacterium]